MNTRCKITFKNQENLGAVCEQLADDMTPFSFALENEYKNAPDTLYKIIMYNHADMVSMCEQLAEDLTPFSLIIEKGDFVIRLYQKPTDVGMSQIRDMRNNNDAVIYKKIKRKHSCLAADGDYVVRTYEDVSKRIIQLCQKMQHSVERPVVRKEN